MPEQATSNKLWSHSCIERFSCPWAWWAHYEEKRPGYPVSHFEAGSVTHRLAHAYLRGLVVSGQHSSLDYARVLAGRTDNADAQAAFMRFAGSNTFEPGEIVGLERWMIAELPEGMGTFRGRIDLLTREDDRLFVRDLKSGWKLDLPTEHVPVQLLRYAWLVTQQEEFRWAQEVTVGYVYAGSGTAYSWEVPLPVGPREIVDAVREVLACRIWEPEPGWPCNGCEYLLYGDCKRVAVPESWDHFEALHRNIVRLEAELRALRAQRKKLGEGIGPQLMDGKLHGMRPKPKHRVAGLKALWNAMLKANIDPADWFGVTPGNMAKLAEDPEVGHLVERLADGSEWASWDPEPEAPTEPIIEEKAEPVSVEATRVEQLWGVLGFDEAQVCEVYRKAGISREAELTAETGDKLFSATEGLLSGPPKPEGDA